MKDLRVADWLVSKDDKTVNGKRIIVIALIAALFVGTAFSVAAPRVAAVGDSYTGMFSSIAIDGHGRPHISAWESRFGVLRYTWEDSAGTWHSVTVPQSGGVPSSEDPEAFGRLVGLYTSIALDSHGRPHISYYDEDAGWVKYATQQAPEPDGNSPWTIENVAQVGQGFCHTSIALDSVGNPRISYLSTLNGGGLYYAWRTSNGRGTYWSSQIVESGNVGYANSLKLDAYNRPSICYCDAENGLIEYATSMFPFPTWSVKTVSFAGKTDASAWADVRGLGDIYGNPDVKAPWPFGSISLALDSKGNPHISYYDITNGVANGALKYVVPAWSFVPFPAPFRGILKETAPISTVATGGVGISNSLVLEYGKPVICYFDYHDYTHENLMFATQKPGVLFALRGGWQLENVDTNGVPPQMLGAYCSMAFRPPSTSPTNMGTAISYFDSGSSYDWNGGYANLKYARLISLWLPHFGLVTMWDCRTVDGGYAGMY